MSQISTSHLSMAPHVISASKIATTKPMYIYTTNLIRRKHTKAVLNNSQNHGTLYLPIVYALCCKWDKTSTKGTNGGRWWHGIALHSSRKSSNSVLHVKSNFKLLSYVPLNSSTHWKSRDVMYSANF